MRIEKRKNEASVPVAVLVTFADVKITMKKLSAPRTADAIQSLAATLDEYTFTIYNLIVNKF